jgi:hypothetical protein
MQSYCYSCQILINLEFPQQIFEKKCFNINFHKNPDSGSRFVPCEQRTGGRTEERKDIQTDMAKLILLFAIFRKPLKFAVAWRV